MLDKFNDIVSKGQAEWLETDLSLQFGKFFDGLPWKDNRLDFDKIGRKYTQLNLYTASDDEVEKFLESSALKRHKYLAFVYDDKSPILISEFKNVVKNIKEYLTYTGDVLAFSLDDLEEFSFNDFLHVYDWVATTFRSDGSNNGPEE